MMYRHVRYNAVVIRIDEASAYQINVAINDSHTCLLFNDTAATEIYTYVHTLSLHDALPFCTARPCRADAMVRRGLVARQGTGGDLDRRFLDSAALVDDRRLPAAEPAGGERH